MVSPPAERETDSSPSAKRKRNSKTKKLEQKTTGQVSVEPMCQVRLLFQTCSELNRNAAIPELARVFGYQRVGKEIRDEMNRHLLTAVRRGIIENEKGTFHLFCRTIDEYDRDFLKKHFVASLPRRWITRKEAIQVFARSLGFQRAGKKISDGGQSLINGLLRTGRIEKNRTGEIKRV